jgi:hypothetical protein
MTRTVWLKRDPVGAHTELPPREEWRSRFAQRAVLLGGLSAAAFATLLVLRTLERAEGSWPWLGVAVFWFGVAGAGSAAVALRTRSLRSRGLTGLALSLCALVGLLFVDRLAEQLS